MPHRFTCPQGHEWELPGTAEGPEEGASQVCPVCSAPYQTPPPCASGPALPETGRRITAGGDAEIPPAAAPTIIGLPVIPGYEILRPLGAGGMGQVFEARQVQLNRLVALKVIHPHLLNHPDVVRRFRREARAAARLAHPNIVSVHDAGQAGELHFLALEYVDGIDLARLVRERGPLPVGQACDYVRQASLGLQHAHERGLVHRDVKPANLLLAAGDSCVKLLDLGLALCHAAPPGGETSAPLTQQGALLGTPDYMAPEQALDFHTADERADIYSLGCTLYYLLTGRPPFPGGSLAQKLLWHQQAEVPPVRELRPDVPAGLLPVLGRMLAKRPEDRYQSAGEVAEALAGFLPGEALAQEVPKGPVPPHAPPRSGRRRIVRGRPWIVAGVGGLAAACLVVFLLPSWQVPRKKESSQEVSSLDRLDASRVAAEERFDWQPRELVAVLGEHRWRHWHEVRAVAISPDGRRVAGGGDDPIIYLWGTSASQPPLLLRGHTARVNALAFSHEGSLLASAGEDRTVILWEPATGDKIATLTGHADKVHALAFSPDDRLLATAGEDKIVRVWDVATRQPHAVLERHTAPVLAVAFAGDNRTLASGGEDRIIRLWDVGTRQVTASLEGHGETVRSVAFAPEGKALASGSKDRTVRLWDVAGGKQAKLFRIEGAEGHVHAVAFAPDGRSVLSGSQDGIIRRWDLATGTVRQTLAGHAGPVWSVALSRDGRTLVSGGDDHTVRWWDADTGEEKSTSPGHRSSVSAIAFARDGTLLASTGRDGTVKLWEPATAKLRDTLTGHRAPARCLALSGDGAWLASGGFDAAIRLWNLRTGAGDTFEEPDGQVCSLAFALDHRTLVVGTHAGVINAWDLAERKKRALYRGANVAVTALTFSPDGQSLASGHGDWSGAGQVRLCSWPSGRQLAPPPQLEQPVASVAFSPDGQALAWGGGGRVSRWEPAGGQARVMAEEKTRITAVAFAPKGRRLAWSDERGRVVVWDDDSRSRRLDFRLPGPVWGLAFAPDGRHLASANANGTVYLFRLPSPES